MVCVRCVNLNLFVSIFFLEKVEVNDEVDVVVGGKDGSVLYVVLSVRFNFLSLVGGMNLVKWVFNGEVFGLNKVKLEWVIILVGVEELVEEIGKSKVRSCEGDEEEG